MIVSLTWAQVEQAHVFGHQLHDALETNGRHYIAKESDRRLFCLHHELICLALAEAIGGEYLGPEDQFQKDGRDMGAFEVKAIDQTWKNLIVNRNGHEPSADTVIVLGAVFQARLRDPILIGWAMGATVMVDRWRDPPQLREPGWLFPQAQLNHIEQLKETA